MYESSLSPMEALKAHGLSTATIARIAHLRVPLLRALDWERLSSGDPAHIYLSNAASLLDSLTRLETRLDAAAFYEEQIVIIAKDGETFYCPAYHLYESDLWSQQNFIEYAKSAVFYSRIDFAEEFPLVTKVVDAPDGYKAIVCKYPVERLDFKPLSSLAGFTVIR